MRNLVADTIIFKKKRASCWSCSRMCITMHGPENVKHSCLLRHWRLVQWCS